MSDYENELIAEFIRISRTNKDVALFYLIDNNWDLRNALNAEHDEVYYDEVFYPDSSDSPGEQVLGPPNDRLTYIIRMAQKSNIAPHQSGNQDNNKPTGVLKLWRQGFSIDDGELHRFGDREDEFLLTLMRGGIPQELLDMGYIFGLDTENHRHEDYPDKNRPTSVLKVWRQGFSIDDGELHHYGDREHEFLLALKRGSIPQELVDMGYIFTLHIEDHRHEDYIPTSGVKSVQYLTDDEVTYPDNSDRSGQQELSPPNDQLIDLSRMAQESNIAPHQSGNQDNNKPTSVLKVWRQGFSIDDGELHHYGDREHEFLLTLKRGGIPQELLDMGYIFGLDTENHLHKDYPDKNRPTSVLKVWRQGFSIDDGELHHYGDREHEFLLALKRGSIPQELVDMGYIFTLHIEDHRHEDYIPTSGVKSVQYLTDDGVTYPDNSDRSGQQELSPPNDQLIDLSRMAQESNIAPHQSGNQDNNKPTSILKVWRQGFSIDDGELHHYGDREHEFLLALKRGSMPQELVDMGYIFTLHIEDHRHEDYIPTSGVKSVQYLTDDGVPYPDNSNRSGQQELGPPKDQLTDMFRMPQESNIADPGSSTSRAGGSDGETGGQGVCLDMVDTDHTVEDDPRQSGNQDNLKLSVVLKLWKPEFSFDDEDLRQYGGEEEDFELNIIPEIPQELLDMAHNDNIDLEDNRYEDYKTETAQQTFRGSSQALVSPVPNLGTVSATVATSAAATNDSTNANATNEAAARETLNLNTSAPTTTLQIRLADGSRFTAQFNLSHTLSDIRRSIQSARPDCPNTNFTLESASTIRKRSANISTIESAGLKKHRLGPQNDDERKV